MNSETRSCESCKKSFVIEPEDFTFYEKVKVPPPTWCPNCRYLRRMSWRNMWHLFKRKDDHSGETIFSLFPEESPAKVYEREYWNSDAWDPMEYGRDYDWQRPFFEQFRELLYSVPAPAHSVLNLINCRYCTNGADLKNCYLVRASTATEDSAYLIWDHASKSCMDSHMTDQCELSYGNVNTVRCFKTLFSVDCEDCSEVIFSKDCVGCTNCFGCIGLRNKSYYFLNEKCTKEEYAKKLAAVDLKSDKGVREAREKAHAQWKSFPHKYFHGRQNVNISGDYISESKNTRDCFRVRGCEDIRFCQNILTGPVKDSYDFSNWGENVELLYECLICGNGNSQLRFCAQCYPNNRNLEYCVFCQRSSNLFGCVGLKDKQYCIFNKQFSEEEYEDLVPKLKKHMTDLPYRDKAGNIFTYGEFFPPELSAFPYYITEASEFFPLSEAEASTRGFVWYSLKKEDYQPTISAAEIPDRIDDVKDSIINEAIGCEHGGTCDQECTKAFRVIKEEVDFCKRLGIPLPRLCPNCRHYERLKLRNSPQLFPRACMCDYTVYQNSAKHDHHPDGKCPNEFETSYSPDRPEIVYCEKCYQQEVV